jgi:hypothetical protein
MTDHPLDDDTLLRLLREAFDQTDPVPADAVAVARDADPAGLDDELAELVFDSLLDERPVVLRDAGDDVRSLTFTLRGRTLELDVAGSEVVGTVTPSAPTTVEVLQPAARRSVETDELGRFRAALGDGPFRLRVATAGIRATTPWVVR